MEDKFLHKFLDKIKALSFSEIALVSLIVYSITFYIGWFNFCLSAIKKKIYIPLESYILYFENSQVTNNKGLDDHVFDLTGFHETINSVIPYKVVDDIFFILISTVLVVMFFYGYKKLQSEDVEKIQIIKWGGIFAALMALTLPSNSSDIYGYIARGAQQILYNHNPYFDTVSEIDNYAAMPLFANFDWATTPTTYGPVFVFLTKAFVLLSNNSLFLSLFTFKVFNLLIFFLLLCLVQRIGSKEDLYLIAFNPLILIQGLWNGHNDLLCGFLIFSAFYYFKKENFFLCSLILSLAAGVKYVSVLIIPIVVLYLLRNKMNKQLVVSVAGGFGLGIVLVGIFSYPYLITAYKYPVEMVQGLGQSVGLVHQSLTATIFTLVDYIFRWTEFDADLVLVSTLVKYLVYISFLSFYIFAMLKAQNKKDILGWSILVTFVFLSFALAKFHSWYLLNVIVLIPFLEDGLLKKVFIALSMSHVYAITFFDQAKILNFLAMTFFPTLYVVRGELFNMSFPRKRESS